MLSGRCSVCPVCDVGVLWPKGWMDQDKTLHVGRGNQSTRLIVKSCDELTVLFVEV